MTRNTLELLLQTKTNKSFTQRSMKTIGNSNAKEWPTNLRYSLNRTPNNGDRILTQPKIAPNSLKRSNYFPIISFPQARNVL
jgi:hypothetical protein